MRLETNRLSLRLYRDTDASDLLTIYQDEAVCRYLLEEPWTEADLSQKMIEKCSQVHLDKGKLLSLAVDYQGKVIGDLTAWRTEMPDSFEIGYVFSPDYSGLGLATEAVSTLVAYLFEEEQAHRIQANLDCRNEGSKKLCKRLGMRQEAHFIQDFWNKGEWTDSYIYAILANDYEGATQDSSERQRTF